MGMTGGCHCGAVRYSVAGEPQHVALCHCSDCRKSAGAPMVSWAAFAEGEFDGRAGRSDHVQLVGPVDAQFLPEMRHRAVLSQRGISAGHRRYPVGDARRSRRAGAAGPDSGGGADRLDGNPARTARVRAVSGDARAVRRVHDHARPPKTARSTACSPARTTAPFANACPRRWSRAGGFMARRAWRGTAAQVA